MIPLQSALTIVHHAPVSKLPSILHIGTTYALPQNASDPDSEAVIFSVITRGLINFTLDSLSGYLKWQPDTSEQNLEKVIIKVSDRQGAFSTFTWNLQLIETITPTSEIPFGNQNCHIDSSYTYTIKEMPCSTKSIMYRFIIDGGEPSPWSQSNILEQKWTESGTHKIQAQVHCNNFFSPSQLSEPLIVKVRTISETPLHK